MIMDTKNEKQTPERTERAADSALSASPGSELDMARILIAHAVDAMLETCGNSYVNAYTEQWLDWAQIIGAYKGPVIGRCDEVSKTWNEWLEENELPEIPDSPHWLKRLSQNVEDRQPASE